MPQAGTNAATELVTFTSIGQGEPPSDRANGRRLLDWGTSQY
jgi:hypothetical protein